MRRRCFLKSLRVLPLMISASGHALPSSEFPEQTYRKAIVIDGLGFADDPDYVEGKKVFSPRGIAELKESGVTAFHSTVSIDGNEPGGYEGTLKSIASMEALIAANSPLLTKARTASVGSRVDWNRQQQFRTDN